MVIKLNATKTPCLPLLRMAEPMTISTRASFIILILWVMYMVSLACAKARVCLKKHVLTKSAFRPLFLGSCMNSFVQRNRPLAHQLWFQHKCLHPHLPSHPQWNLLMQIHWPDVRGRLNVLSVNVILPSIFLKEWPEMWRPALKTLSTRSLPLDISASVITNAYIKKHVRKAVELSQA